MKSIGIVKSQFTKVTGERRKTVAEVVLDEAYTPALEGIEDYSHVIILFWMHKIPNSQRKILKVHPRGHEDMPIVGVFATRGKSRPNPIGLAVVELIEKQSSKLIVKGLDAFDGTPILDIKPYDHYDVKKEIRVPKWWLKITKMAKS